MSDVVWHHTPAHYTTPNVSLFWTSAHSTVSVHATNGYGGTPALTASSTLGYIYRQLRDSQGTDFGIGARVKATSYPAADKVLMAVTDASANILMCLALLTDGNVAAFAGNMETLLGISDSPIGTGVQVRIGMTGRMEAGTGRVEVKINGNTVIDATDLDTGSAAWIGIVFGVNATTYISHMYATLGSQYPAYLIDIIHSTEVDLDDADPDGDTTTESLTAIDDTFFSGMGAPTSRVTCYGVQAVTVVKLNEDSGGHKVLISVNGIEFDRNRQSLNANVYQAVEQFEPVNPLTGTWWDTDAMDLDIGGKAVL